MPNSPQTNIEVAKILAEHYQHTVEQTVMLWKQRNRIYLILIGIIAIAAFLSLQITEANNLFVDLVANILRIEDTSRITQLRTTLPFGTLQTIFLAIVFYLQTNLYHRELGVRRNYLYLGKLEIEIRQALQLEKEKVAFTREGSFYWSHRPPILRTVGPFYSSVNFVLLVLFLFSRLASDYNSGEYGFLLIDSFIAVGTLIYFSGNVLSYSINSDKHTNRENNPIQAE